MGSPPHVNPMGGETASKSCWLHAGRAGGVNTVPCCQILLVRGTSATCSPPPPVELLCRVAPPELFASPPLLTSHFPIPVARQLKAWWGRRLAGLCADQGSFLVCIHSSWLMHATAFLVFLPQILGHAALLGAGSSSLSPADLSQKGAWSTLGALRNLLHPPAQCCLNCWGRIFSGKCWFPEGRTTAVWAPDLSSKERRPSSMPGLGHYFHPTADFALQKKSIAVPCR